MAGRCSKHTHAHQLSNVRNKGLPDKESLKQCRASTRETRLSCGARKLNFVRLAHCPQADNISPGTARSLSGISSHANLLC